MDEHASETRPPQRTITTIPFDQRSVSGIGQLLGLPVARAPFQLPGGDVHQITVERDGAPPVLMLTLWPTIHRVDAIGPLATVVFTHVSTVDLIEGVEVLFRRSSREYLIITLAGKVIVRA